MSELVVSTFCRVVRPADHHSVVRLARKFGEAKESGE
jgi:hypothetical protein